MTEYLRRPDPDAASPKADEPAPEAERAQPAAGQTRTSSPAPRFRYRAAGTAQDRAQPPEAGGQAVAPLTPDVPEPGELMASARPSLADTLTGAGTLGAADAFDPQYWKGLSDGLGAGITQALPRLNEALHMLPELPGAVRELVALLRGMTPDQRQHFFTILGINYATGQLAKTSYQRGEALGEQAAGLLLGAGASKAVATLRTMQETGAVVALLDRLHPPGPKPVGATASGGSVPVPVRRPTLNRTAAGPTVAGGATTTGAEPAALPKQAKNWSDLEALIGQPAPAKLPDGYFYRTDAATGKLQVMRKVADDDQFQALTTDKQGRIQVADGRTSDRISNAADMKRNFKLAAKREVRPGFQLHHLIPDNIVRSHPLLQEMLKRGIYNLDRASNLVEMPGADRLKFPGIHGHFGSHPKYDELVRSKLDEFLIGLRRAYGSLENSPDTKLKDIVQKLENNLKNLINSDGVPTRLDPDTGTKVLADDGLDEKEENL